MKRIIAVLAMTAALSQNAVADKFVYKSDFLQPQVHNHFPGLLFSNPSATVTFTDDNEGEALDIKMLTLNFSDTRRLRVTNFTKTDELNTYQAEVRNAWYFSKMKVVVKADSATRSESWADISIFIPSEQNKLLPDGKDNFDIHLASFAGHISEITSKRTVQRVSGKYLAKPVYLALKDRLSTNHHLPWGQNRSGFEIDVNWRGHGVRTLFVNAPVPEDEFHNYKATGFTLTQEEYGDEDELWLTINYQDKNGVQLNSHPHPLSELLRQHFPNAFSY